jgi:hypothetical protein
MRRRSLRRLSVLLACSLVLACSKQTSVGEVPAPRATSVPDSALGQTSKKGVFRAAITAWFAGPRVTFGEESLNSLQVTLVLPNGTKPTSIAVREVFPYMKIHGHGAPGDRPIAEAKENVLTVSQLGFSMSGPWELNVRLVVHGQEDVVEIPVQVP